jgi:hypothetical protein
LLVIFNYLTNPTYTDIVHILTSTDRESGMGTAGHGLASIVLKKKTTTEEHIKAACSFW